MDNNEKKKNEFYNREVLSPLAFVIPLLVLMVVAIAIPMEYNFLLNPELNKPFWFVAGWYASGFATLYLIYKAGTIGTNVIGSIMCFVFGPVSLAAFGIIHIFKKMGAWK